MAQLAQIGQASVDNGMSLEETLKTNLLTEDAAYEEIKMVVPIGLDRPFVITRAWEEANGKITPRN